MKKGKAILKRIGALLLAAVMFICFVGAGTKETEETYSSEEEIGKAEPAKTIVFEEETVRERIVIDDGNIYIVDSMVKVVEGGSLEVSSGALIIQKGIKFEGDILVSGKGILINEGVIGGTVVGQAEGRADYAVMAALETDDTDNIIYTESSHIEKLIVGGMTKVTNRGKIESVEIEENLEGIFNNERMGIIDTITVYTQKDVAGNVGNIENAEIYGMFWNGDRGHVDTVHTYDGGYYCNHDGATTQTAYIHGGTVNNHQGYMTNLNEDYDHYEMACIDTVVVDVRNAGEEDNLQNGGYIRTLTARNGVVSNYGCIDYAFLAADTRFKASASERFYEEYLTYMEENPEEPNMPFENVFPELMDRNGIYWELNGGTTKFCGKSIVDTLCVNGSTIKAEEISSKNILLSGKTGAELTLTDSLQMLVVGESVRYAQIDGEDVTVSQAGICGSVPLSTKAEVEKVFIPEENQERVGRYIVGTTPQTVVPSVSSEAGVEENVMRNTSKTTAEITDGFQKDFFKKASTGLWYAIDCEKFSALNVSLYSSSMGVATLYTPEGEVILITSAGTETSAGCVSETGGTYYLRIFGGSGEYSVGVEKTEPLKISYEISSHSADGTKSIIPERKQEYQVTLYNQTQNRELSGIVYQSDMLLVSPDQVQTGDKVVARVHNLNGKNADTSAEFTIPSSNVTSFQVEVVPRGRFVVTAQDTEEVSGYLYDSAGVYQEILETTENGFTSSYLEAGTYQAVFIRGGNGLYKFPTISAYADNGMTEGKDYLLCTVAIKDGADTEQSLMDLPEAPSATHPALNKEGCMYTLEAGSAVADSMVQTTLRYAFMEEASPSEIYGEIQLNEGTTVVEGSVAVDGEKADYTVEKGILRVPLTNYEGTVCFFMTDSGISDAMVSSARLRFLLDGKENIAIIGSSSVSVTNLSVNAPEYTSDTTLRLWGYGPAGEDVVLLDNQEELCHVSVDRRGFWSQEVTLPENAEAGIHTLCAVCGNISSKTSVLRVTDSVPRLVNFTMYYMFHDAMQKLEIPGELMGASPIKFEYMPGTDFTFSIHMTDNDRIDRLFINAEMDGDVRTMEAFYQENTGRWDAVGRFSDDASFVPSSFSITYIRKNSEKEEEVEAAETAEEVETSGTGEAWFDDAGITLTSYENYTDQIGFSAELMMNLYGEGDVPDVSIPATYSCILTRMENPKGDLESRGFAYLGTNNEQHDEYIFVTQKDDYIELEVAIIVPEIGQVETCQYFYSLLRDALNSGEYSEELAWFDISGETFDGYLMHKEETLDMLDYVETAVADYENALHDGNPELFFEKYDQYKDTENVETAARDNGMSSDSMLLVMTGNPGENYLASPMGIKPNRGVGTAVVIVKFGVKKAFQVIDIIGKLKAVHDQTQDFVAWREAEYTKEMMLDIMNDISSNENAWAMNDQFLEAQREYERAQEVSRQKAEAMNNRLWQEVIGIGLDGLVDAGVANVYDAIAPEAKVLLSAGMKDVSDAFSDLNKFTGKSAKEAMDAILRNAKDNKLANELLVPFLEETDAADILGELVQTAGKTWSKDTMQIEYILETILPTKFPDNSEVTKDGKMDIASDDVDAIKAEFGDELPRVDLIVFVPTKPNIDPSGYVYEAVESNRIADVKATVYWKDGSGDAVMWDAAEYDQENPLFTNDAGYYEWFVPAGDWRVVFEKEGYDTLTTEWLPVPPPQTEVNVGIVSREIPNALAYVHKGSVEILFDRYMVSEEIEQADIRLVDDKGNEYQLKAIAQNAEETGDGSGILLADTYKADVDGNLKIGKIYRLDIPGGLTGYAGVATEDTILEVVCTPEIMEIDSKDELLVESGGEVRIPIRIHADGKASGVTISCESEQRGFVRILDVSDTRFTGFCVIKVQTDRTGTIPLTITADGTNYSKTIKVTVIPRGQEAEKGKTLLKIGNHPVDSILVIYIVSALGILIAAITVTILLKRHNRKYDMQKED